MTVESLDHGHLDDYARQYQERSDINVTLMNSYPHYDDVYQPLDDADAAAHNASQSRLQNALQSMSDSCKIEVPLLRRCYTIPIAPGYDILLPELILGTFWVVIWVVSSVSNFFRSLYTNVSVRISHAYDVFTKTFATLTTTEATAFTLFVSIVLSSILFLIFALF